MIRPLANYPERETLRAAYLAWLSRCEQALRHRPTPQALLTQDKPSAASIRRQLLSQI